MMKYLSNIFFKYLVTVPPCALSSDSYEISLRPGSLPRPSTQPGHHKDCRCDSRLLEPAWCADSPITAALKCFKTEVFDPVKERVREAVLELALKEREGDSIDHLLVKNVVKVLHPGTQNDTGHAQSQ